MAEVVQSMYPGLKKLTERVEDYHGYEEPSLRSRSDEAIRRCLIDRLDGIRQTLAEEIADDWPQNQARLTQMTLAAQRKLNTLVDSLSRPTYRYASFFNGRKITTRLLNRLYDLECGMLEDTDFLFLEVRQLSKSSELEQIREIFLHIGNYIDDLNQQLFEREALIIGEY